MIRPLWFFWGQDHMSFLRWLTLYSACRIHEDVRLIYRAEPVQSKVHWSEQQDWQLPKSDWTNWRDKVATLSLREIEINEIAPGIAKLQVSDVHTSDLLAWYLLTTYGGTVADMDILFLKPLPEIIHNAEIVRFTAHPKPDYIPVSFMQGKPCDVWRNAYWKALSVYDPNEYESCGTRCLEYDGTAYLDEHIVFPFAGKDLRWSDWHRLFFSADEWSALPDTCCGIHWYAGHNQKWNIKLNDVGDLTHGLISHHTKEILKYACISS